MGFGCPKCNMESGSFSLLREAEGGLLVCSKESSHRYRLDSSGFLVPAEKQV